MDNSRMYSMYAKAREWIQEGREVALATVIATWGSSPRQAGSQLVIDAQGAFEGSVSGGCIEGAVITEALEVIADGIPRRLFFGVSTEQAWDVGLACGGEVEIYLEKVSGVSLLDELALLDGASRSACVLTELSSGSKTIVALDDSGALAQLDPALSEVVTRAALSERSMISPFQGTDTFVHIIHPPLTIIIIGAVHIAQPLVKMAHIAGYRVIVIDPRASFATNERFPQTELVCGWPDEELSRLPIHARTAIVTLAHDPKLDDAALKVALRSRAFYIGALGSTITHGKRLARLKEAGFTADERARIQAPVGLDIGALTPAEIAIATIAQVTLFRRKPDLALPARHRPDSE